MAIDLAFRRRAVRTLTNEIGCYVLCDLNNVPIYVGQSRDGIRARVNRHLTSARSDIIANRQVDVWEIAFVWAYPVATVAEIGPLEDALFHAFHNRSALMNGKVPALPLGQAAIPEPAQIVQVMRDVEIAEKCLQNRVVTVPGIAFGSEAKGFLRISFCNTEEKMIEGVRRMKEALAK